MHCALKFIRSTNVANRSNSLAYRNGIASAIVAPAGHGVFQGLSVAFSLGSRNKLEKGAVFQEIVAVHVSVSLGFASSVSTQIATLRRLLLDSPKNEHEFGFQQASKVDLSSRKSDSVNELAGRHSARYHRQQRGCDCQLAAAEEGG
jgi:hypothetical protein